QRVMISSLMFIWLRSTLPQFASYLSSFQTDPSDSDIQNLTTDEWMDAKEAIDNLAVTVQHLQGIQRNV
ncbi:hypothetical protein DA798_00635, partial [Lactobacillus sp. PFC-70]